MEEQLAGALQSSDNLVLFILKQSPTFDLAWLANC